MQIKAAEIADIIRRQIEGFETTIDMSEVGTVISVGDGIARIYGLDGVMAGELIELPHDVYGLALNLEDDNVGCVLMGEVHLVQEGDEAKRSGRILDIPAGPGLVGRVVDPLGRPLDGKGPIEAAERYPLERTAPGVVARQPVKEPMQTGIKAIDSMIPIGRGQRELIIGDRQTGKTAVNDGIETGRRLVVEEDLGIQRDRARQTDTLLHPAGDLCRHHVLEVPQADELELHLDHDLDDALRSSVRVLAHRQGDVLGHRERVEQRPRLEQHPHASCAHPRALELGARADVTPQHRDAARASGASKPDASP